MRIIDGIKLQGRPAEIPDCGRGDLPQFFVDMGYTVGAEIGVYKGGYTEQLCKVGLKVYAVDPWRVYSDYSAVGGQKRLDVMYAGVQKSLSPYHCIIIRKTSMEALEDIPDSSLDFVYIDANHEFKYVAEDICEWSKKVRVGGVISGHDYFFKSYGKGISLAVPYVVNAYTQAYGIENWHLLGRTYRQAQEKIERWRSWMWLKTQ